MLQFIKKFLRYETIGGLLLAIATVLALLVANSPVRSYYNDFFQINLTLKFGGFGLDKALLLWINDGLMAIFFFMVGLELKREWLEGALSNPRSRPLPTIAALFGMLVPAIFYLLFNHQDPTQIKGWAIPAATDIAFALGVLSLFGRRVPIGLKVFLVSLAIMDDVGVIIIIAIFYTKSLSWGSLALAAIIMFVLWGLNKRRISALSPYIILGIALWYFVLKSGVHATIAGVILSLFIPMHHPKLPFSPLKKLENDLHGPVTFFIMPLFAFANAGIPLAGSMGVLLKPLGLGIMAGLLLGKPIGVLLGYWLAIRLFKAEPPRGINSTMLIGVAFLCGIGFTMSLFITMLAFQTNLSLAIESRLAILVGSFLAMIIGALIVHQGIKQKEAPALK